MRWLSLEETKRIEEGNTVGDRGGGLFTMRMRIPGEEMMMKDVIHTGQEYQGVFGWRCWRRDP